jgi:hypothetical protein
VAPDPLLRVLALYGIGTMLVLLFGPSVVRLLDLPPWVGAAAAGVLILGFPVIALIVWLVEARR